MKRNLLALCIALILSFTSAYSAVEVLKGIYQGKNLFVQNTMTKNMSSFSTKAVFVNNEKVLSYPNTTSFEIDLSHVVLNAPVVVKIVYIDGCRPPRVLNSQVIKSASKISFLSFTIDEEDIIWVTRGEAHNGVFYLQQFMNHRWSDVLEVKGKHSLSSNNYSLIAHHHHGLNQYRIKYVDSDGKSTFSGMKQFTSSRSPITFYPKSNITSTITFVSDHPVYFEIFNKDGSLVLKGRTKVVNCSSLEKEKVYSISFDNQHKTFLKK